MKKITLALLALALLAGYIIGSVYPLTIWEDGSFAIGQSYPYAIGGCLPFALCND